MLLMLLLLLLLLDCILYCQDLSVEGKDDLDIEDMDCLLEIQKEEKLRNTSLRNEYAYGNGRENDDGG